MAFMMLAVLLLAGGVRCIDPNDAVDRAVALASKTAHNVTSGHDVTFSLDHLWGLPVHLHLELRDNTFRDPTTLSRSGDAVITPLEDGQVRLEAELSLSSMVARCGQFDLRGPLFHATGSAEYELKRNTFGLTAMYGPSCVVTAYAWEPQGTGTLTIESSWILSGVAATVFNILDRLFFGDVFNDSLIGNALGAALNEPLTAALQEVLCPNGSHSYL